MKFALYTPDGTITSTGACPNGTEHMQVLPGTALYLGAAEQYDTIDIATGQLVHGIAPPKPYSELRRYPRIEDQLDAIWHAMDRGDLPSDNAYYRMIKAIKVAHPKPEMAFDAYVMPEH